MPLKSNPGPTAPGGPILQYRPFAGRLFAGRLWREGGALLLILPSLWMLFGLDPGTPTPGGLAASGWPVWLLPTLLVYTMVLALGLRSRIARNTLWLEGEWLVQSPDTARERRLDLEWLAPGSGLDRGPLDGLFGSHRLTLHDGRRLRLETTGLSPAQLDELDRELRRRTEPRNRP